MKAAPFSYVRPDSLDEALSLLERLGADCRLLAGGMSLVPMMAMRIARPSFLVDVNRLADLKQRSAAPGFVRVGATMRQRDAECDVPLRECVPLMAKALQHVGHAQTRNRGTIGGSIAHADPSAELPLVALVLGATMEVARRGQPTRRIAASDFFVDIMTTTLGESDCLVGIEWPVWEGAGVGTAFEETSVRHGDFAIAAAAAQLQLDSSGRCTRATFGLGGVAGTPLVFPALAAELCGHRIDERLARAVAQEAARRTSPVADLHADERFRKHLAGALLERALLRSAAEAAKAEAAALAP